jgi:hypothetical protein
MVMRKPISNELLLPYLDAALTLMQVARASMHSDAIRLARENLRNAHTTALRFLGEVPLNPQQHLALSQKLTLLGDQLKLLGD